MSLVSIISVGKNVTPTFETDAEFPDKLSKVKDSPVGKPFLKIPNVIVFGDVILPVNVIVKKNTITIEANENIYGETMYTLDIGVIPGGR